MKELVETIAKALVDHPEDVTVTEKKDGKNVEINLHVASGDMGKVIG
ncbi:MAG: KH domain-containing protein, partial [Lachnospiraceae bacterium]|nr:KH domain-containing protein [Lachnospiraceae bacterium]